MMVVMAGSIFSFLKKQGLSSSDICSSAASTQVVSAGVNFSQISIKTQVLLQVLVFGGWGHLTLELSGDSFLTTWLQALTAGQRRERGSYKAWEQEGWRRGCLARV